MSHHSSLSVPIGGKDGTAPSKMRHTVAVASSRQASQASGVDSKLEERRPRSQPTAAAGTPDSLVPYQTPERTSHVDPTKGSSSRIERNLRYLWFTQGKFQENAQRVRRGVGPRGPVGTEVAKIAALGRTEALYEEVGRVVEALSRRGSTPPDLHHVPSPPGKEQPPSKQQAGSSLSFGQQSQTAASRIGLLCEAARALPSKAVMLLEAACGMWPDCTIAKAELAICLLYGHGAAVNVTKALQLLDSCIADGHPGAFLAVGRCLRDGVGVQPHLPTALHWIHQAANLDYLPAMHELGEMYEEGVTAAVPSTPPSIPARSGGPLPPRGGSGTGALALTTTTPSPSVEPPPAWELERDLVIAFRWYKAAAEKGYVESQLNLGKLFLVGGLNRSTDINGTGNERLLTAGPSASTPPAQTSSTALVVRDQQAAVAPRPSPSKGKVLALLSHSEWVTRSRRTTPSLSAERLIDPRFLFIFAYVM